MYQSVLLAADGSDNSFRAAKELMNFIDEKTRVTILNVIHTEHSKDEVLHAKEVKKEELGKLEAITSLYNKNNVDYNVVIKRGIPDEIVLNHANSKDYEIITLGSRGLNSLQEIMMGSLSRKVAQKSEIPVLIVK